MDSALWIIQGLLAAMFGMAGIMKSLTPREKLVPKMPYMADLSDGTVKLLGISELLGAIGLVVPWLTGIAPMLTPLAAIGLVVVMILAARTHIRRKEQGVAINAILGLLAAFVALGRLGAFN